MPEVSPNCMYAFSSALAVSLLGLLLAAQASSIRFRDIGAQAGLTVVPKSSMNQGATKKRKRSRTHSKFLRLFMRSPKTEWTRGGSTQRGNARRAFRKRHEALF